MLRRMKWDKIGPLWNIVTLKVRLSRRVIHRTNIGPKPYLRKEEEMLKEIFDCLLKNGIWKNEKRSAEDCRGNCPKEELRLRAASLKDDSVKDGLG